MSRWVGPVRPTAAYRKNPLMAFATVSLPPRLRASSGLPGGLTGLLQEAGGEVSGVSGFVILGLSLEVAGEGGC